MTTTDPRFAPSVPTYVAIRYALGEVVTRSRQLKRGTNLYERTGRFGGEHAWRKLS